MGIGQVLLPIFISAALLWVMLRVLAKHEADLSVPRYPLFGACYWFLGWLGVVALQWGAWTLIPLALFTIYALYQFFYVTIVKSCWVGVLFVVLRALIDVGLVIGLTSLMGSTN